MDSFTKYLISTALFGVVFLIGLGFFIFYLLTKNVFMTILMALVAFVAIDNFFCGARAVKAGCTIEKRYLSPLDVVKDHTKNPIPKVRKGKD